MKYPTPSKSIPKKYVGQKPKFNLSAKRNGTKNNKEIGTAKKMLFANSKDCLEFPHSVWEKASANIEVNGNAVKKPANMVFFPDRKETKLIKRAAVMVFNKNISP